MLFPVPSPLLAAAAALRRAPIRRMWWRATSLYQRIAFASNCKSPMHSDRTRKASCVVSGPTSPAQALRSAAQPTPGSVLSSTLPENCFDLITHPPDMRRNSISLSLSERFARSSRSDCCCAATRSMLNWASARRSESHSKIWCRETRCSLDRSNPTTHSAGVNPCAVCEINISKSITHFLSTFFHRLINYP